MRSLSTRIFSLLLAFVLCFGMVSVSGTKVSAAEAPTITVTALVTDSKDVQAFEVVTSVDARYTARYGSEEVKGTVAAGTQELTFNTDSEVNLQVYTTYINDAGKQKNVSVYKTSSKVLLLVLSVVLLCSCSKKDIDATGSPNATEQQGTFQTQATAEVVDPSVAANELDIVVGAQQPVIPDILEPVASGLRVAQNDYVTIDYSNTQDGYVMVRFHAETSQKLKTQIIGTTTTYTYNLYPGEWAVFPLSDGNGHYQIKVFQNVSGSQYALVLAEGCDVVLVDEFAPFLRPNQYVNYSASSVAVKKAAELTEKISNPLEKVAAVYDYIVKNLSYDVERAATVKSGYIPDLDSVLAEKKGICFDYAALMTGMLRSQGIPCKMVFGYAGSVYHAWINVWTADTGWLDGVIYFDGRSWQYIDPTFASSAGDDASIKEYIGNGSNYTEKYMY